MNIFDLLKRINSGDHKYIDGISDAELSEINPYMLMCWLKGADTNRGGRAVLMDEIVMPYMFALSKHKRLLLHLLCESNSFDDGAFFKFIRPNVSSSSPKFIDAIIRWYSCSKREAETYSELLGRDDIKEIAVNLGYDKKTTEEVLKSYDSYKTEV